MLRGPRLIASGRLGFGSGRREIQASSAGSRSGWTLTPAERRSQWPVAPFVSLLSEFASAWNCDNKKAARLGEVYLRDSVRRPAGPLLDTRPGCSRGRAQGPSPSPLSTQSTARPTLPPPARVLQFAAQKRRRPGHAQARFPGSEQFRSYRPELGIALQNELRALADIECIYEEQRDGLKRSALPPSIKEHWRINGVGPITLLST